MHQTKRKIFVFGSNREGRHVEGAALYARKYRNAEYGNPSGLQGDSYAIITKELRPNYPPVTLDEVQSGVAKFLDFASRHQSMVFEVTPIGCGLAGFTPDQIAPMFYDCPENVILPPEFLNAMISHDQEELET